MFKNPFSFEGRIRRIEYGLSHIIAFMSLFIVAIIADVANVHLLYNISIIPFLWFMLSQGTKRCHDLGRNGCWQLIPFYGLWMLFEDGESGENLYGENPKGIQANKQH